MNILKETRYSPAEAAKELGVSKVTVLNLIKNNKIDPIYRVNQRVIQIPQSTLESFLASVRVNKPVNPKAPDSET